MADISIVFCGEAGQGLQTIEYALTHILKQAGYYLFATQELMSRIRGGGNSTQIRIADYPIGAFLERTDLLISLAPQTISRLSPRISSDTIITGVLDNFASANKTYPLDFGKITSRLGSKLYESSIAIGLVLGILKIAPNIYQNFFTQQYAAKSNELADKNIVAVQAGYDLGNELLTKILPQNLVRATSSLDNKILLNGSEALALGAIAGGCNFISSYPMSPSTGVLTQLATFSHEFDIVVEQAEDEISAINMAQGAWYAGGRALVTTSGGGFALMCEGLSLAGMTETPVVISLGQRPGPATGLPTRTEQGDLNLALYAGHGEFPRIIFAPGTMDEAFYLMQKAFNLADKYQIPVIVLSDQFLVDSYFICEPMDPLRYSANGQHIVKTTADYQRFQLTPTGVSLRGIPGFGEGIVCVDSDEHTNDGFITEDFEQRNKMVQKRLRKFESLKDEIVAPTLIGNENYKILLVSWGSNYHVIQEALDILKNPEIACLHFSQVFPLAESTKQYFTKAENTIVIENNATGQFANLLKQYLNIRVDRNILKYNGLPFAVEEITNALKIENFGARH